MFTLRNWMKSRTANCFDWLCVRQNSHRADNAMLHFEGISEILIPPIWRVIAFRFIIELSDELMLASRNKESKKHLFERKPKSLTAPFRRQTISMLTGARFFQETLADESIRASATDSKWKTQNVLCRRVKYLNDSDRMSSFLSVHHSDADDSRDNLWKFAPKNLNETYGRAQFEFYAMSTLCDLPAIGVDYVDVGWGDGVR